LIRTILVRNQSNNTKYVLFLNRKQKLKNWNPLWMMQLTTTRKPWMKMRNYWLILKGLIIMQGYVVITVVLLLKATSTEGHLSYQASRFQIHWVCRLQLHCPIKAAFAVVPTDKICGRNLSSKIPAEINSIFMKLYVTWPTWLKGHIPQKFEFSKWFL
jgi:hypothetical protein